MAARKRTNEINTVEVINRDTLIEEIQDDFAGVYSKETIEDILNNLEYHVVEHLKSAKRNKSVSVRLFMGLQLSTKYIPESEVDFKGKTITRTERIQSHAKFTRYFTRVILNGFKA